MTWLIVLFVWFVIDNVVLCMNLATQTCFQKIAVTQKESTSNLSVEQIIDHSDAIIVVPVAGPVVVNRNTKSPQGDRPAGFLYVASILDFISERAAGRC